MDQPLFSDSQFLDQNALNAAFGLGYASAQQITDLTNSSGLINPASLTITEAALVITVAAPSPFAVLFGNGALTGAHGNTNGADTSTYAVNMAPLVPGSGSVTAYVLASFSTVLENAYEVIGPPAGHPDFNPSFAPYTAYADTRDTLTLTASTAAPDNVTTFELCRTTLTAGQSAITVVDTSHWVYASSLLNPTGVTAGTYTGATVTIGADGRVTSVTIGNTQFPTGVASLSANTTITGANAGTFYDVSGSHTITLNASTFTTGQTIGFLARQACTITASSGTFYGGSLSGTSIVMPAGSFVALQWDGVNWRQLAGSFAPSPSSLAANGWKKYLDANSPTGFFIEQWFTIPLTVNTSPQTVAFPLAFPNACLQVSIVDAGGGLVVYGAGTTISATGFELWYSAWGAPTIPRIRALGY